MADVKTTEKAPELSMGFDHSHTDDHDNDRDEQQPQDLDASFRKDVEKLLLCPVCHETVTDPRRLICGHFFCSECVDLLTVDDAVRCAICQASTPITEGGLEVHELAASLLQLLAQYGTPTKPQAAVVNDDELAADQTPNGLSDENVEEVESEEKDASSAAQPANNGTGEKEAETSDVIIDPPQDYQSPDGVEESEEPLPPPPPEALAEEPVLDTAAHESAQNGDVDSNQQTGSSLESSSGEQDGVDSRMKASEIKPSTVAISIEMERQCGDCHSNKCTCNCNSTLLTPPVSNGSQLSVETNTSSIPSDEGEPEIPIKQLTKFVVPSSASHIEVANNNKIYATRWTYDEDGSVWTFDRNGKKMKFLQSGHHDYTGITLSKLGFIFALNSSKKRVEEFNGINGKKVKQFKLDLCSDPHAVGIMPTGEVLVVDQEKNSIIVYPNNKKLSVKPRRIKHELIQEPYDIATTAEGFYVTCAKTRCLLKMDLSGNVIWTYGGSSVGKRRLRAPQGVCIDDEGRVYVVDKGNHNVLVFTKDGELKGHLCDKDSPEPMKNPWYISVRDGLLAILFSHNVVKTYNFV